MTGSHTISFRAALTTNPAADPVAAQTKARLAGLPRDKQPADDGLPTAVTLRLERILDGRSELREARCGRAFVIVIVFIAPDAQHETCGEEQRRQGEHLGTRKRAGLVSSMLNAFHLYLDARHAISR